MRLEHHLVGGYVRYISPHIIIIIIIIIESYWKTVPESWCYKHIYIRSGSGTFDVKGARILSTSLL